MAKLPHIREGHKEFLSQRYGALLTPPSTQGSTTLASTSYIGHLSDIRDTAAVDLALVPALRSVRPFRKCSYKSGTHPNRWGFSVWNQLIALRYKTAVGSSTKNPSNFVKMHRFTSCSVIFSRKTPTNALKTVFLLFSDQVSRDCVSNFPQYDTHLSSSIPHTSNYILL